MRPGPQIRLGGRPSIDGPSFETLSMTHAHSRSHCVGCILICVIIGDDVSDGGGAQSHADVENNNLNGEEEVQETSMHEERIGEGVDEDETTQDAIESRSNARGSRASTSSISSKNGNKRKKTKDNIYGMTATKDEDVLTNVFDAIHRLSEASNSLRFSLF
ncbi:hypothetical protein AMTRI_Chr07g79500 [Amborella trichopoda]